MKPLFITATDTEIGKTYVCAALAHSLKKLDIDVGIMKPFACGVKQKTGFSSMISQYLLMQPWLMMMKPS